MKKVASVSSEEELLTILDQLQVSSAASYQASGIETSHRTDSTNSDYYYIFNSTEETQTTTMTLEGQGTPYIMDSWSGEITQSLTIPRQKIPLPVMLPWNHKNLPLLQLRGPGRIWIFTGCSCRGSKWNRCV